MSILRITGDLNYNTWTIEDFFVDPRVLDLQIGFKSMIYENEYIEFVNLKYGFFLYENNITIQQASFPPAGIKLLSSDQPYIDQIRLNILPDHSYTLHVWAENSGVFYDHRISLNIPKYEQPFASWTWNGSEWVPPTAYPADGELYVWEEDNLNWVLYDPALSGTLPE
jgi:hypothetical protein